MIAALLFCVIGQTGTRPGTLPPSAELNDRSSFIGNDDGLGFFPDAGGLLMTLNEDLNVSRSRTSDAGLMVNLHTAELNYIATPDITDLQILCPSGLFIRSYRSELAKLGKHSPGLPDGWVHNYDLIIKLPEGKEKWEPITLTYPNKAQEKIEPELDDQGKPTGRGKTLSNATYDVSLVPGDDVNTYQSVTIQWPNTHAKWTFEPHVSGVMVLRAITSGGIPGGNLRLSYLPDRTLDSVSWVEGKVTLLKFNYSGSLLATIKCRTEEMVGYTYDQVKGSTVLWKVTDPFKGSETPKDAFVYKYANDMTYPGLTQIWVPDGHGWSKSWIEYKNGLISAVQGASGVRQEVGPPPDGGGG